jgi:bifunctional non-homologous end joining protein LigD
MPTRSSEKKPAKRAAGRLKAYREKRDFTRTAEPKPKIGRQKAWRFAVQRHDARRLHFDLRLELDGVLKSWAVARGISMVPGVKRLAVQTEDHPLDYLTWEGTIPKGEYGGGTMIVWDRGTWMADGDPHEGIKNGKFIFALNGERLKGHWHFVRMKRKPGETKDNWLLFKGDDEYSIGAADPEPVATELTSVISGLTNEDLEKRKKVRPDHKAREKIRKESGISAARYSKLEGAKKSILPVFVEPALAEAADGPPTGKGWLHEIKQDGYRMQARIDGGKVKLLTRKNLDWTKRFPTIAKALEQLPVSSALIDGELVAQEESGISTFTALQSDLRDGRRDRLGYFLFDLLYCEGVNLTGVALKDRKEALEELSQSLPAVSPVRYSQHMDEGDARTIFQHACQMGLEGLISKRADAPYRSGRTTTWIKSKCTLSEELIIIGYVPSSTSRQAVGSLVLGFYDKGKQLVHAGRAGTGFTDETALALRSGLEVIETKKPNFKQPIERESLEGVRWVEPRLVADIQFRGWSPDRLLRQAAFKGIREDKAPEDVVLEEPWKRTGTRMKEVASDAKLSHPDRILWPQDGITKQGLAEFYTDIADWILPHVTGRVLSLVRCPGGVGKSCFYAKHIWEGAGKAFEPVDVGEAEPMMAIRDIDGLLTLVQANVLEIHPWGSRVEKLEQPDRIIFDLDPGEDVAWEEVIAAAVEVKERLKALGLDSFVKTTGGKGLHVVSPIVPQAPWDKVKAFTKTFAEAMAADSSKYLAVMSKSRRKGRIFVDYLRNGRGATAVAAYSTRARNGAAISVPLTWSELQTGIRANHFTIDNLRQRLSHRKRDPWAGFFSLKQKLPPRSA